MTKNVKRLLVGVGLALVVAFGWLAFQDEGALRKAGGAVDETIDDMTHPNETPIEEAGRKVSEAVDDS